MTESFFIEIRYDSGTPRKSGMLEDLDVAIEEMTPSQDKV